MKNASIYTVFVCTSLLAFTFQASSVRAAGPIGASVERMIAPVDENPTEPLPNDDPDAPIDPTIPDPYAGIPEPVIDDGTPTKGDWIKITFLVSSGLPNPTVLLATGDDFNEIDSALSKVAESASEILPDYNPEPALGYNGVLMERFSEGTPLYSYTVQDNILSTGPGSIKENYALRSDAAIALETSLLSIGQSQKVLSPTALLIIEESKAKPDGR